MPAEVRVTRKWHPLKDQVFPVVSTRPTQVVIRLANGTHLRMPHAWTDAAAAPSLPDADRYFTVDSLVAVLELAAVLRRRS